MLMICDRYCSWVCIEKKIKSNERNRLTQIVRKGYPNFYEVKKDITEFVNSKTERNFFLNTEKCLVNISWQTLQKILVFAALRDGGGGYKQVEQLTKVPTSKLLLNIFDDVDCPFTYDWTKTIILNCSSHLASFSLLKNPKKNHM